MTDAELTLMSLLAQGPRYGHEIQQLIDERGLREWVVVGFSSIYYLLNKLERHKLIVSELKPGGRGPARKQYQLTDAGQGVLQTAIANLLREPRSLGSGFELGLANLNALKPAQVYQVLGSHRRDLQHQLQLVQQSWNRHQQDTDDSPNIRALYTHSIAIMEAELAWLTSFLTDWETRYPAVVSNAMPVSDEPQDSSEAETLIHKRTTPDPLKMIQRLKPPKPPQEPDDQTGGDNA